MSLRTSLTHPLQISDVDAPGGGNVGITFCPGKRQAYAATGVWERDLQLDLQAVRDWGAGVLVTLVTAKELRELGVESIGPATEALGMAWLHLPIIDVSVPDAVWRTEWSDCRQSVHGELDRGGKVLVHCKGGLGRAGTVAALILVERGMVADEAIQRVRSVRPGALETRTQERFVRDHQERWQAPEQVR